MASYADFVGAARDAATSSGGILRDWANRDNNVLPHSVITRCLDWGADECYRRLRIPPLELTRTITLGSRNIRERNSSRLQANVATFAVPSDFIEVIYLYKQDGDVVFNSRLDSRTIIDSYADKPYNSFTRTGNNFEIFGDVEQGDTITVHYYRRLPALDSLYAVTATNFNGQTNLRQFIVPSATQSAGTGRTALYFESAADLAEAIGSGTGTRNIEATATTTSHVGYFEGIESAHWLRDENERILTFGAMMEVFNYLDEPESYQRYALRFAQEIEELNSQERMRDAKGGNVVTSYSARGLI